MSAASLSDLLSAAKSLVQAVNSAAATFLGVRGTQIANGLTASTVVRSGTGRLASISVVTGAAGGLVYDSKSTSVTTNPICAIPAGAGVYVIDMPFTNGLLVVPGAGSSVTVSYSTGQSVGYTS